LLEQDTDLQLVISAPCMREDVVTKPVSFARGGWAWTSQSVFRVYLEPEFLPLLHLLITVRDAESRKLVSVAALSSRARGVCGHCTVPLFTNSSRFCVTLTKDGALLGTMMGSLAVNVSTFTQTWG